MEVEDTSCKKRVEASRQEVHLSFVELRRGEGILEPQSQLHFSLHLCQLSSMVLNSIPEIDNLIGSAQPMEVPSGVNVQL